MSLHDTHWMVIYVQRHRIFLFVDQDWPLHCQRTSDPTGLTFYLFSPQSFVLSYYLKLFGVLLVIDRDFTISCLTLFPLMVLYSDISIHHRWIELVSRHIRNPLVQVSNLSRQTVVTFYLIPLPYSFYQQSLWSYPLPNTFEFNSVITLPLSSRPYNLHHSSTVLTIVS